MMGGLVEMCVICRSHENRGMNRSIEETQADISRPDEIDVLDVLISMKATCSDAGGQVLIRVGIHEDTLCRSSTRIKLGDLLIY